MRLSALFITPAGEAPLPVLLLEAGEVAPACLALFDQAAVWRARFTLPADRMSSYAWNGETYQVASDLTGDLRLAYVSCNGEEVGDMAREGSERNAMWARLRDEHRRSPFALMLHGGDQIYADEVTQGHELSDHWPDTLPPDPSQAALADLRRHLRQGFFDRYAAIYAAPEMAWLAARVPSLMQWDDHDICDGWGSLRRSRTYSPVGQTLFAAARESCLIFQHAATDGDLPARFADPDGRHLGWGVHAPGLRILAPDLRSERTRRAIMGPGGWAMMEAEAARRTPGHTLLMSSVPLLGPRLSVLETLMVAIPSMQKYEDDLRDQWQSRAHREEWRHMLRLVQVMVDHDGHDLTSISGEIHLATRAVMDLGQGRHLNQLVASGVAHRAPPKGWAGFLGALASLGESPLRGHPIKIRPLPGQSARYVAERNYLVLERCAGGWAARWDLEAGGMTGPLPL
ncbi:alkaline phosphatase D family protein [Paracoccus hibiscisoli]